MKLHILGMLILLVLSSGLQGSEQLAKTKTADKSNPEDPASQNLALQTITERPPAMPLAPSLISYNNALDFVNSFLNVNYLALNSDISKKIGRHVLGEEAAACITKNIGSASFTRQDIRLHGDKPRFISLASNLLGAYRFLSRVITIIAPETGQIERELITSQHWIRTIKTNRLQTLVAVALDNNCVKIFDVNTGTCIQTLRTNRDFYSADFAHWSEPDDCIITTFLDEVSVWSIETGMLLRTFSQPGHPNNYGKVSKDGDVLLLKYENENTASIWNIVTGDCLHILDITYDIYRCIFSPRGDTLVTMDINGNGNIWSMVTGEDLEELELDLSRENEDDNENTRFPVIMYNSQGNTLLGAVNNQRTDEIEQLQLWQINQNAEGSPEVHVIGNVEIGDKKSTVSASALSFNPAGNLLLVGGADGTIYFLDVFTGECLHEHSNLGLRANTITFNDTGNYFLTLNKKTGTVLIWSAKTHLICHRLLNDQISNAFFHGPKLILVKDLKVKDQTLSQFSQVSQISILSPIPLLNTISIEQAFLLNAIYELIKLRRIAHLRSVKQLFSLVKDSKGMQHIAETHKQSLGSLLTQALTLSDACLSANAALNKAFHERRRYRMQP